MAISIPPRPEASGFSSIKLFGHKNQRVLISHRGRGRLWVVTLNKKQAPTARRGRRPGISTTRQAILDAARTRFASDGFAATTIRQIAADAEVDASLVMQFFGSKSQLFAEAMSISPNALARLSTAFEGPDAQLGEQVVRAFLDVWEGSPQESEPLIAMLRGAIVNEQARTQLREFIQARLIDGARSRAIDDAVLRAGLASSMLVGLIMGRRIVGVPVLAGTAREKLVALAAPAIQSVLTSESILDAPTGVGSD
ncbi:TetR family transcriptional regulator [Mycobacterium marseillense]|uniref:TetR/AcrR family transcriptional regulator n=1 Tax=Mycobacterium marseillense TaxID=701042 RepID=UPI00196A09A3|nr:TetR family transcriptional regulator [Mycobacterium marseillense]MCA2261936.1 TetR family transcriptional regulator [Mycobacterium marseillense]